MSYLPTKMAVVSHLLFRIAKGFDWYLFLNGTSFAGSISFEGVCLETTFILYIFWGWGVTFMGLEGASTQ